MLKKITLALLLCCVIVSCGRKAPPEYPNPEKKVKIQIILINKA